MVIMIVYVFFRFFKSSAAMSPTLLVYQEDMSKSFLFAVVVFTFVCDASICHDWY